MGRSAWKATPAWPVRFGFVVSMGCWFLIKSKRPVDVNKQNSSSWKEKYPLASFVLWLFYSRDPSASPRKLPFGRDARRASRGTGKLPHGYKSLKPQQSHLRKREDLRCSVTLWISPFLLKVWRWKVGTKSWSVEVGKVLVQDPKRCLRKV